MEKQTFELTDRHIRLFFIVVILAIVGLGVIFSFNLPADLEREWFGSPWRVGQTKWNVTLISVQGGGLFSPDIALFEIDGQIIETTADSTIVLNGRRIRVNSINEDDGILRYLRV